MLKFIDLFCGIGGFRLALEKRGLECVFSSDIDLHAREAYRKNFGEMPSGDITKIHAKDIPSHDVLCGGFPCQPFSASGKKEGTADPRGKLFFEIARIAEFHKPKAMVLENVKNILTISGGNVVRIIEKELGDIGYDLHWNLLNASFFGVPQARERVYFVAVRRGAGACYAPPKETFEERFLEDVMERDVERDFFVSRDDICLQKSDCDVANRLKPIRIGFVNKGGQGERIYSVKGHAVTQSAYGGGVGAKTGLYLAGGGVRRLTINECKRVMGFPDGHAVGQGTQGYKQLGNAVVPAMIGHVFDGIGGL